MKVYRHLHKNNTIALQKLRADTCSVRAHLFQLRVQNKEVTERASLISTVWAEIRQEKKIHAHMYTISHKFGHTL